MTSIRRRIGVTIAAALSLGFTSMVPMVSAHASPSAYQCDEGRDRDGNLVVFADQNYEGECRAWSNPQVGDLRNQGFNDQISSLKNRTANTLCFYSEERNQGAVMKVQPWQWQTSISLNDQISSFDYC
ncbi:peptidase inhibitor family I36 protein [Streptomyces sp. ADI93-02]|uniref:peptidase inhibitor family I36 protein n=1 Tax=Streptomyces sp. ADI93-02 TaxID=1522757 RepID=UPI000F552F3B|nr:peptidase inhibitor family I36 protein [Streptomyces sp. ADI93-02]RPK32373.1 hypothetical protein EES40_36505 [Streptomyces sp. ADI93-02]